MIYGAVPSPETGRRLTLPPSAQAQGTTAANGELNGLKTT